jgi:hypothetical protein
MLLSEHGLRARATAPPYRRILAEALRSSFSSSGIILKMDATRPRFTSLSRAHYFEVFRRNGKREFGVDWDVSNDGPHSSMADDVPHNSSLAL